MKKPAETDRPIHDLIRARWSPRAFDGRSLTASEVATILEAGRWAPSCFNEQPWRFLVALKENDEQFRRAVSCLTPGNLWAENAGVLIFTAAKINFTRNDKPNRHAMHDVGLAVENMVIQATADGFGCHQMAGIVVDRVRELYGVPDGFEIVASMAIGHVGAPDLLADDLEERERAARSRLPIQAIAFEGSWGAPFRT